MTHYRGGIDWQEGGGEGPEPALPWDDPNADPIGDIKRAVEQMKQEYQNTWLHRFDNEGRCVYCEVAAHNASRYPCIDQVRVNTKETNEEKE